jgi:hypothetical protein
MPCPSHSPSVNDDYYATDDDDDEYDDDDHDDDDTELWSVKCIFTSALDGAPPSKKRRS